MATKRVFKKLGKILAYIILGILLLLSLSLLFLNLPVGKRLMKNKVQQYLQDKFKTKVAINSVDYSLPKWVEVKGVYFEDQKKDTLLYGGELRVDLSMFKLISGDIDIKKILLKDIAVNINRESTDSTFNFQYIVDAFSSATDTTLAPDTAEMKLSLKKLELDNVVVTFRDNYAGSAFFASIDTLNGLLTDFHPERLRFAIDEFYARGVNYQMTMFKPSDIYRVVESTDSTISPYQLKISAGKLNLHDVKVDVDDKVSGMYYSNNVHHLGLSAAKFDMNSYYAAGDSIILENSYVRFRNPKTVDTVKAKTVSSSSSSWTFDVRNILFQNTSARYDDDNIKPQGGFDLAHFDVKNLQTQATGFLLTGDTTAVQVAQLAFSDQSGFQLDSTRIKFLMTEKGIEANEFYIKTPASLLRDNFRISYDSVAAITLSPQNTLVNARLKISNVAFDDLYTLFPFLKTSFDPAYFAHKQIKFNTELRGSLARAYLPYLQIEALDGSRLSGTATLFNLTNAEKFYYDLNLSQSSFRKSDILKFVPKETQQQFADLPEIINLTGHITGNRNNLKSNIRVSGRDLLIDGNFVLNNISNPSKLNYQFGIREGIFNKNFIMGFIPPGSLPPEINLPDRLSAKGSFKGTSNDFVADLKLGGSYGDMTVKGSMNNIKDPQRAAYDLVVGMTEFQIGKMISQDSMLGNITGKISAKGKGFDYKTMIADVQADIDAIDYNNYRYKNLAVRGQFNNGLINTKGRINDDALKTNFDFDINAKGSLPTAKGYLKMDTIQLKKLNLYDTTLNLSFIANLDAKDLKSRELDARLIIDSMHIQLGPKFYSLDSVSLVANSENGIDTIRFYAPFARASAYGAFDYDQVGNSLARYIDRYYNISNSVTAPSSLKPQDLTFQANVYPHPLVMALVPNLNSYEEITMQGNYASDKSDSALKLILNVPALSYANYHVGRANLAVNGVTDQIDYLVTVDTLDISTSRLYGTRLSGDLAHDSLYLGFITQDNKKKDWFGLNGSLSANQNEYYFRLGDTVLLNYDKWNVADNNYIKYGPAGTIVHNFNLSYDTSLISINSRQEINNAPIDVNISKFDLGSISSIMGQDTLFASGSLDAKLEVTELEKNIPAFTGNLNISGLSILQQPMGNLSFSASKKSDNNIDAHLLLQGDKTDIEAGGSYFLNNPLTEFDGKLDVRKLDLSVIAGLSRGTIKQASGNMHGSIEASGRFANPDWAGELKFDTTSLTLNDLGSQFQITNQSVILNSPDIGFNNFTVKDSLGHEMIIDGGVRLLDNRDIQLGFAVNATEFILLNAPSPINRDFYGHAAADINIGITGTATAPVIEGDVFVNEKSDVTIVIPQTNYNKDAAKGIVRFIDRDTFDINPPVVKFKEEKEGSPEYGKFLQYNLNLELNKYSSLKIIIDPTTGDEIKLQGDAQLNAGVDPGGNLVLAGNYLVDKGYYIFNYQFLQRRFEIEQGSLVTFGGEPMNAIINVTAVYNINTTASNLVENELSASSDPILTNSFRQKLPFRVLLNLTGTIAKPTIKFDIVLPDNSATNVPIGSDVRSTIDNKLSQIRGDESSMNKQVFSLLLMGRFVGEQSSDFFKGNGGDFSDLATQSVSQFLSSALDEIASDLFKGIDVDLNLNSYRDYSNGGNSQRTDLNVALSKSFANDRLTITVGKNFGVQGNDAAAKAAQNSNSFLPDINLAYKLTKDGKYMVRAYRRNQYEVVLDGYVVETGVGFVVTMDYYRFRQLFMNRKKRQAKEK
jgi:hypothetical protein